ncbi:hypothetical protein SAMN05660859_0164 [Ancylobacter rudongensis]|uniref:Uncharacterized protein n=1 Tax=Ancylobacter rudongensis TaxID=177413 RepID=A0A1G4UQN9_9HYPH|nr:hypothetical protein SAMN05660859_0164 [Ancylobacter rudongensis]
MAPGNQMSTEGISADPAPAPAKTASRLTMRCSYCDSENVMRDAWATWSVEDQSWCLGNVFDAAFCEDCENDTKIVEGVIGSQEGQADG